MFIFLFISLKNFTSEYINTKWFILERCVISFWSRDSATLNLGKKNIGIQTSVLQFLFYF